jgi:hypothetical protein
VGKLKVQTPVAKFHPWNESLNRSGKQQRCSSRNPQFPYFPLHLQPFKAPWSQNGSRPGI